MPRVDRTVSDRERDAILTQACARNLPIEVTVVGGNEMVALRSRLLKAGDIRTGEPLVIEAPTRSGAAMAVRPDESINVLMMLGGQRYGFRAAVKARGHMHLGGAVEVPTLSLEYPQKVIKLQRRRFFRVRVPGMHPIVVKCIVKDEGAGGSGDEFVNFETIVVDISSGGMAVKVPKRCERFVREGRRLALLFKLEGFARPIRLIGEIKHLRSAGEGGDTVAGLQFVEWHKTLAGRRAVNVITRYVVRRQRAELKKKSGLDQ